MAMPQWVALSAQKLQKEGIIKHKEAEKAKGGFPVLAGARPPEAEQELVPGTEVRPEAPASAEGLVTEEERLVTGVEMSMTEPRTLEADDQEKMKASITEDKPTPEKKASMGEGAKDERRKKKSSMGKEHRPRSGKPTTKGILPRVKTKGVRKKSLQVPVKLKHIKVHASTKMRLKEAEQRKVNLSQSFISF